VVSSVDLRTRTGSPIAAEAGTVIQGSDTALVTVAHNDDPIRLGRTVLDSLAANLANRSVHETFLRKHQVRPQAVDNPLMHDFRASACSLRMGRAHTAPPSFFITTCEGRLSIDHPAWVFDDSDPTFAWNSALTRALLHIADRA
jgi:hypothetical protein